MSEAQRHRLGLLAAFAIGSLVATQSRINGALGARLHDGVASAVVSFGSGFLVLCLIAALSPKLRANARDIKQAVGARRLQPWQCIGGVCGAIFVSCQGIAVGTIGVALFTVAAVGGQIACSLVVDRMGIGPAGVSPFTTTRVVGAVLAVVAVGVAGADKFGAGVGTIGLAVLPALAGLGLAWQQAVNGRVSAVGGPIAASWLNFGVGTFVLVIVGAVVVAVRGWPSPWPTDPRLYIGGVLGIGFIAGAAVVVRWIGVLLLGMGAVAGQLVTAMVIDLIAPSGDHLSVTVVIGCAMTLVAVAIAASRPVRAT